jgi:glutamate-1-semialdehyde 2,1-aminomutase/spore coat polysaccharide biosynthesis protein SpsF
MEPIMSELPRGGFLKAVRDLTHREGALLVFDEVATGFRFALEGAQAYLGVTPDVACFGKAMGNGMPISCIVGCREVMQVFDEVFFSLTFGGECLSLAASLATIREIQNNPVIPHLWELGRRLQDGFNTLSSNYDLRHAVECVGLAPRSVMLFREAAGIAPLLLKSLFQQEALKRGILFSGAHCLCYSHSEEDIEMTLGAYQEALEVLAVAIDAGSVYPFLEGRPVEPVFRPL